jgi:hypothetical protein
MEDITTITMEIIDEMRVLEAQKQQIQQKIEQQWQSVLDFVIQTVPDISHYIAFRINST